MIWKFKLVVSIIVVVVTFTVLANFFYLSSNRTPEGIVYSIGVGFIAYLILKRVERIPTKRKRRRPRSAGLKK